MDSHQLSVGGQHAVLRALGTGRATLYHLHRLCAGPGLLFQKCPVLPGHQNDLADQRTLRKGADAPLHHGLPAQIKAELVKPHAVEDPAATRTLILSFPISAPALLLFSREIPPGAQIE